MVIGASSGLGRCIGVGLAQRGARVALLARRRERIEAAAKEAGPGAVALECDVTDEASCRSAVGAAADALGGIDHLIYTPAVGPLVRLVDTDAGTWRHVFDTNVIGAALATAAAVPHLTASAARRSISLLTQAHSARRGRAWCVRRQQGSFGEARRGMASRTPWHRFHLPDRWRVRGR
ncbi:short chain dehydrogenase family protein [Mycobacterium xenopi 4042]|uniref:Short chain dehydrogenase family protein n=1 Tax=Mycobacterium xenopi 4042 TaxID=1299334 RepID=X8DAG9_MYCXE|nr:short chain dehydrogenase family protein [Mycobacterium xenopi 4042]